MPVGVPKVPFLIPGDEEATWVDLYRLYRERVLFVGQEIDNELGNQVAGLMLYLDIEDPDPEYYLFINSPGGLIVPGISIFDAIQVVTADVHTICMGIAASMASFILLGGTQTKRIALPHARVMIHQPVSSFFRTETGEFIGDSDELLAIRKSIVGVYVQRTGKSIKTISEDMERDGFMSATKAKTHGIIDLIGDEAYHILTKMLQRPRARFFENVDYHASPKRMLGRRDQIYEELVRKTKGVTSTITNLDSIFYHSSTVPIVSSSKRGYG
uniref:ATP-dependent Clp protease proteolytic subunit n=1 Tax=Enemion raddeanum TaxID=168836 RepID=A0A481Y0V7_9MAGN|nr:clp protease proteolytic subunit [Enemion raddeanum]QBK49371.1 clp protease proteolytic subunit [Enemion raddeanum]